MKPTAEDENQIRKYLLGQLGDDEQSRLEERLMVEDELYELSLVIEDELVDDRVMDALTKDERERFDSYFLSTPERRRKLRMVMAMRKYVPKPAPAPATEPEDDSVKTNKEIKASWWSRLFSPAYMGLAAAAIVLIAVGVVVWLIPLIFPSRPTETEIDKGLAALNKAYSRERPLESRITGFDYAPFPRTRGNEQEEVDSTSLRRAEITLIDEVEANPSPAAHHALGRLYLAKGEFNRAFDQFDKALKDDPNNAQLHSSYATALFEAGKADKLSGEPGKGFEKIAKAIEHFNRALGLNSSLLEALFNRALLFEERDLPQAEKAWREYLDKDANSAWADEARQRLTKLEEKKKARSQNNAELSLEFLQAYQSKNDDKAYELMSNNTEAIAGRLLWWQLVGAYLDHSLKHKMDEAAQYLQALAYAGQLQRRESGDSFMLQLSQLYRTTIPERQTLLAQAHNLINQAHKVLSKSEINQAADLYVRARDIFDKADDQIESWFVSYWIGYCHYRSSDFKKSLSVLYQVAEHAKARNYLWLRECALTMIANIYAESNNFSKSLAYYNESLEISRKINDKYNTQKNLTSLAYIYKNLGDGKESLAYMYRGLEQASSNWAGIRQMYRNFDTAAGILNSFGYYAAAAEYGKAALMLALEAKDPGFEHLSYMHLGAIYAQLQDYDEAMSYAERSYQVAKAIANENASVRPVAHSSLQLAHLYRQARDYNKAVAYYEVAIGIYRDINLFAYLYEAHKGKLLCYISQGDDLLAEDEMQIVLAFFEQHRSKIREEKNKNSFFDLEQYVYDIAIDFEYSRKRNYEKAFDYSETSRARSLLDLMNAGAEVIGNYGPEAVVQTIAKPLAIDAIQKRLPDQSQILQYSVLDDKLLIWVVSSKIFEVAEKKITSNSLTEKTLAYWQSISSLHENGTEESRNRAAELYEILIKPVESLLDKDRPVCVVPDKALNYLPFNALIYPDTGRYLIKDYLLSFAPSTNTFLLCSQAARERAAARNERVLSIGNPRFDRDAFPNFPDLPSSVQEAEEVSRCYSSKCCLVEEQVKKARVISEMAKADVIHIASHYDIDERNPMLSKLLLTAERGGDSKDQSSNGFLQAYDIYQKKLPVTRLVTLSACQTGIEQYYKGEGMIGMSRTFLIAGVPLVVASLWPVASDPTADLMISFHRYRKHGGLSSAQALRQAQIDMIDDTQRRYNQPYYWAPFIIIGGHASF